MSVCGDNHQTVQLRIMAPYSEEHGEMPSFLHLTWGGPEASYFEILESKLITDSVIALMILD